MTKTYKKITAIFLLLQGFIYLLGIGGEDKIFITLGFNSIMIVGFLIIYTELSIRNEERKEYSEAFDELKMKKGLYVNTLGATLLLPLVDVLFNMNNVVYGTMYTSLMVCYAIYLFVTTDKLEKKAEELMREKATKGIAEILEEVFEIFADEEKVEEPKNPFEQKRKEVIDMLKELQQEIENTDDFVSIEKRRLLNEVYLEDIKRKENILNQMSMTQREKEEPKVLEYFESLKKELREMI